MTTISSELKDDHDQRNQLAVEGKDVGGEQNLSNGSVANASTSKGISLGGFSPSKKLAKIGASFKKFGKSIKRLYKNLKNPISKLTGRMTKDSVKAQDTLQDSDYLKNMSDPELQENAKGNTGGLDTAIPDWLDSDLAQAPTTRHVATIAVAQDDPKWLDNVNELKAAAFHKLRTSPKKFIKAVASGQGEAYLGGKVVEYRKRKGEIDQNISDTDMEKEVQKFTGGIHNVGHTWIRLEKYAGEGGAKLQSRYSYGMWPAKYYDFDEDDEMGGYAGFAKPGPGFIRHPDIVHESDNDKVYKSVDVTKSKFNAALAKAQKLHASPPPYVLIGYNCTSFAKEIFELAGGSYPGSGLLPSVGYTPGNLYHAILKEHEKDKKSGAHTDDPNAEVTTQITDETEEREEKFKNPGGSASSSSGVSSGATSDPDRGDYMRMFGVTATDLNDASGEVCRIIPYGAEQTIHALNSLKQAFHDAAVAKDELEQITTLAELLYFADLCSLPTHDFINDFIEILPDAPVTKLVHQSMTGGNAQVPSTQDSDSSTSSNSGGSSGGGLHAFSDTGALHNSVHPDDDSKDNYGALSGLDKINAIDEAELKLGQMGINALSTMPLWKAIEYDFIDRNGLKDLSAEGRMYLAYASGEPLKIINDLCEHFK
ncbi:MAG: hypothetical protein M0T78_12425 [Actinomycetota bacterium]|nr:hypothetical protein [Actinomycetota bacterium]